MATKGKWAQGIQPRHFAWVIQDRLAVCERPGGYGSHHRRIRRQEEIIWIREQGFAPVISIIPASHNLHNYDELGVRWLHRPFPAVEELSGYLAGLYGEIHAALGAGGKVLVHYEELGDWLIAVLAGYLVWSSMVEEEPKAIFMLEHITSKQLTPRGRDLVSIAGKLAGPAT
jgi:hypothetical protein